MNRFWRRACIPAGLAAGLFGLALHASAADYRLRGSFEGWAYGYQDQANQQQTWLVQNSSASLYRTGSPWSLHFSGGWVGDYLYKEGLAEGDQFRFTRGYLRYGDLGSPVRARLGRFFLVRGPAVGVLDGADVDVRLKHGYNVAVFSGLWGPLSREFEFDPSSNTFAFGGEVGWVGRDALWAKQTHIVISYANIQRDGNQLRDRVGLETASRFSNSLTWYNVARFRLEGSPLRRFVSRLRMNGEICTRMVEFAVISEDAPESSWFAGFSEASFARVRVAADRWLVMDKWGFGFDAAALISGSPGYNAGPYAKFPFGRIGYHFFFGDQPTANGWWASLNYTPWQPLELYAYGSLASYEWQSFDTINDDNNEVLALYGGANCDLPFVSNLTLNLEYQHFKTPRLAEDRRAMAGLRWGFDTAGVSR